jgi:hypothetical protein
MQRENQAGLRSFDIAESRRALQFLYDPKSKPGLEDIMAEVLDKL